MSDGIDEGIPDDDDDWNAHALPLALAPAPAPDDDWNIHALAIVGGSSGPNGQQDDADDDWNVQARDRPVLGGNVEHGTCQILAYERPAPVSYTHLTLPTKA